ncbi:hypothetical protein C4B25_04680 [Mycoplasma todarodis]|uniref:IMP dehydrogenase/GMP reductase domain-containing protein n=1 Tax=Mycoplasma todarodis TaxID=1937191 RepID=A0A4R0XIS5_9MOLU|nr:hypothetical protein C4B25_04680 [Mycoplasma todarodis]
MTLLQNHLQQSSESKRSDYEQSTKNRNNINIWRCFRLPSEVNTSVKLTDKITIEIPVISAAMDTVTEYEMARAMIMNGGIGVLHKNASVDSIVESLEKLNKEFGDTKPIATSVGVSTTDEVLDVLVVDSAHGHSKGIGEMVSKISKRYPNVFLIAGNIVTGAAAKFLIEQGANAVKVGVGPGAICTTRVVTGVGAGCEINGCINNRWWWNETNWRSY